jgi:hypothetical protein
MVAAQRFKDRNGTSDPEKERLAKEVQDCKDEAELVSPYSLGVTVLLNWSDGNRTTRSRYFPRSRWCEPIAQSSDGR